MLSKAGGDRALDFRSAVTHHGPRQERFSESLLASLHGCSRLSERACVCCDQVPCRRAVVAYRWQSFGVEGSLFGCEAPKQLAATNAAPYWLAAKDPGAMH